MPILNNLTVNEISGGSSTKLGLSIDNFIGDIDSDGVLQPVSQRISAVVLDGVVQIGEEACNGLFAYVALNHPIFDPNGIPVSAPDLEEIGFQGAAKMFYECRLIASVSFPKLKTIGDTACKSMFGFSMKVSNSGPLTTADLSSVETILSYGCEEMFYGRAKLTSINWSGLKKIGNYAFQKAFSYTQISSISFPSLQTIGTGAFGTATTSYAFRYCDYLTEIHFPANTQSDIEALAGYANKWGATNATIYFDLPATVTLTGADTKNYERNPKYDTATALAWYDTSATRATPYYTSGTTSPVVSDTIYSDSACTVVATTISSIV